MSTYDPVDEAFNVAKRSFRDQLADQTLYDDILVTAATIDDVYQLATSLQEKAGSERSLRHLKRLKPFLDILSGYEKVIETYVQVQPDILALLWGPVRLFLKLSSELTKALDDLAEVTLKIAQALPQFSEMVTVFSDNARVKTALALFYRDILDFYSVMLKMFTIPRWKVFWGTLWDQNKRKVDVIVNNVTEHVLLMRNEVSIAEIIKADEARATSLVHFDRMQKSQELQNFQGLRTRLSPVLYGQRLDWLRNRVHNGSEKWLFQDKVFLDWLDMSKKDTTWLWIQGIPGSGKTYLAAAAVDKAVKQHQTLFVFASYHDPNSTTALSITQSLIFQAAADNNTLQNIVVEFSEGELTNDGGKALELLKALLNGSTGTYIIIDGLDEIEESERRILLQRLDDLVNASSELKVLLSSRPEDDIAKVVGKKSKSLRVDQRNMGSIQRFVNYKTQEWIAHQDFDQSTESEVSALLSPLAARSNGKAQFLCLPIIEEIRRELKALPTDLNDAYHRVFNRINSSNLRVREKARKILGWIGCAPAPMTSLEMEQALLLDASSEGVPSIVGSTNFVKLCGPIVEIVDNHPQFVHFTVREYIFSRQINSYIDMAFANETLAFASVSYLCSGLLDLDSSDSKSYIRKNILAGNYRLLGYVAWYWAGLTMMAVRNKSQYNSIDTSRFDILNALISRTASEVWNYDFEPDEESLKPKIEDCFLDCGSREGRDMLRAACRFRLDERQPDWTTTNADTWVNLDPLITSKIWIRIKESFESLLCSKDTHEDSNECSIDCHQSTLERHYGPLFYKCSYFSCPYSRHGFHSRRARDEHEQAHGRPWKCSSTTCQFADIGFNTKKRRDIHVKRFHEDESEPMMALNADKVAASDFDNFDEDEVQPLLFVLVRAGHLDAVKRLLASKSGTNIRPNVLTAARTAAARQGFMAMTQLLTLENETDLPINIVTHAIESEDAEFVKWALTKVNSADVNAGKLNKVFLSTPSEEIYSLWETYLPGFPEVSSTLLKTAVFNDIKDNPVQEERLARTWKLLTSDKNYCIFMEDLSQALLALARSTMSVRLARALLKLGASVNYDGKTGKSRTALAIVARKTTLEAAEFMKMLLEHGASTVIDRAKRGANCKDFYVIGDEAGARGIQQWLGVTWDELVDMNKEAWKKSYLRGY
ncbi:hypothetical protein GQ53DRAFT_637687 [Thozetella sp. PMI_491]|nr:hypothetical protein GQ53DRAFT_637687 [Thozetella sp. PMI_491]